jgi:hypothetical protein
MSASAGRLRRTGRRAGRPDRAAAAGTVLRYLEHLKVERRVAERTLALYTDALGRLVRGAAAWRCRWSGCSPPCAHAAGPAAWCR